MLISWRASDYKGTTQWSGNLTDQRVKGRPLRLLAPGPCFSLIVRRRFLWLCIGSGDLRGTNGNCTFTVLSLSVCVCAINQQLLQFIDSASRHTKTRRRLTPRQGHLLILVIRNLCATVRLIACLWSWKESNRREPAVQLSQFLALAVIICNNNNNNGTVQFHRIQITKIRMTRLAEKEWESCGGKLLFQSVIYGLINCERQTLNRKYNAHKSSHCCVMISVWVRRV